MLTAELGGVTGITGRAGPGCEKSKGPRSMESLENDQSFLWSESEVQWRRTEGRGEWERRGERKN